jgi:hypothetical protein
VIVVLSLALGALMIISMGAADMPVVISMRHASVRLALAIARVHQDVRRTDVAVPPERRLKQSRVVRHRKTGEGFARRA